MQRIQELPYFNVNIVNTLYISLQYQFFNIKYKNELNFLFKNMKGSSLKGGKRHSRKSSSKKYSKKSKKTSKRSAKRSSKKRCKKRSKKRSKSHKGGSSCGTKKRSKKHSKKHSKKNSKKYSKKHPKRSSKKRSKKKSKKMSLKGGRGSNPGFKAFMDFRKHVAKVIGQDGPIAVKVASLYKQRVNTAGKTSVEVTKEAKRLFDNDNEAQHEKVMNEARDSIAESRKNRKPRKKKSKC
jgi:hypothetical protein